MGDYRIKMGLTSYGGGRVIIPALFISTSIYGI